MSSSQPAPDQMRSVLGNFPTGVVAITGLDESGRPIGMTIGSFTSVSLDPPLVAFLPAKTSSTWPQLRRFGRFAVNFLASDQEDVCLALARTAHEKFTDLPWVPGVTGAPLIDGAVGWLECEIDIVHEGGDHDIVVGRVIDLAVGRSTLPLIFFQRAYGRFTPLSLSAWESELPTVMRIADLARPHMERVAAHERAVDCFATALVNDELIISATAGAARTADFVSRIGRRIPMLPPLGAVFVANAPDADLRAHWLGQASGRGPDFVSEVEASLDRTAELGYAYRLGDEWNTQMAALQEASSRDDADRHQLMVDVIDSLPAPFGDGDGPGGLGTIDVPVTLVDGRVPLVLSLMIRDLLPEEVPHFAAALQSCAKAVAADLDRASLSDG